MSTSSCALFNILMPKQKRKENVKEEREGEKSKHRISIISKQFYAADDADDDLLFWWRRKTLNERVKEQTDLLTDWLTDWLTTCLALFCWNENLNEKFFFSCAYII